MAIKQHNGESNEDMVLKPDLDITFKHKSSIKRSEKTGITLENEKAIALFEGDAASSDTPSGLAAIYSRTRLQADRNVVYPDPESLKKRVAIIPVSLQYAAAAIILLLISVGAWLVFNQDVNHERLRHDLAKLERVSPDLEFGNILPARLTLRDQETVQIQSAQREVVQLSRIKSNNPDMLTISASLASSNMPMYPRTTDFTLLNNDHEVLAVIEESKGKTLMGKIFSGMFGRVKAPFESDNKQSETGSSEGFSFWYIAELGVKSVNALGDHDYTVVRDYNDKGNVKG
ncbi:MAG: hypothetical protein KAJ50_09865, partial [Bacteroidales bacterium]|nr:hypothetical protein [Bacteroidales bacterium]